LDIRGGRMVKRGYEWLSGGCDAIPFKLFGHGKR
jgi:hypothetical protein